MPVINLTPIDPSQDIATTTTILHEVIPITGSIVSGTYGTWPDELNIKNYTHGMFQSVYDYPFLSSSANHIFDLTIGYDETSGYFDPANVQNTKKVNMYNQFAQLLLGYTSSTSDSIRKFESDLKLDGSGTMSEVFFIPFSRLLTKDQIKRNSFSIALGTSSNWANPFSGPPPYGSVLTLTDASASYGSAGGIGTSNGGEYGVLYDQYGAAHGTLFYQAGIAVISASVFNANPGGGATNPFDGSAGPSNTVADIMSGSAITASCNVLRHRIQNISFNNQTEINSTIYFCRIPHNEYNYSSNPTYLSGSKIRVKAQESDQPISYITTVGLYNASGEMLAAAKLSEPLRKDPNNDITIRVRLDY